MTLIIQFQNISIAQKDFSNLSAVTFCSYSLPQATMSLQSLQISFWKFHINGIIFGLFCLASVIQHVVGVYPCYNMYHYFIPFSYLIVFHCMDKPPFIYSFISGWIIGLFLCFGYLIILINIHKQVSVWTFTYLLGT